MLSELFMEFDKLCYRLDLYKLYTIGDCYVLISQLNESERPEDGAQQVLVFAEQALEIINKTRKKIDFESLGMRIGIHTGDVFGGIVGTDIVRFDIYGENVFAANKMESAGKQGEICVSKVTKS